METNLIDNFMLPMGEKSSVNIEYVSSSAGACIYDVCAYDATAPSKRFAVGILILLRFDTFSADFFFFCFTILLHVFLNSTSTLNNLINSILMGK